MAGKYDFLPVVSGDTMDAYHLQITENDVAVNLTNSKIKMDIRKGVGLPLVMSFSSDDETIKIDAPLEGKFKIEKRKIEASGYQYKYDLQVEFENGDVKTYLAGTFPVEHQITE